VYISETTEASEQQHHITVTQHTTIHETKQPTNESDTEVFEEYITKFKTSTKENETPAIKTKKTIIRKKKPKTKSEEEKIIVIEEEIEDIEPQIPSIPKKQFMHIEEVTGQIEIEEIVPTKIEELEETQNQEEIKTVIQNGEISVIEEKQLLISAPIDKLKEKIVSPVSHSKFVKLPFEQEEIKKQVTVTEEVIEGKEPKKIIKKKIIKCKGKKQQITEETTIEEKGQIPITTITEGPEEVIQESVLSLLSSEFIEPLEKEEIKEEVTVTEIVDGKKPQKITKKKIIKHKGQKQQVIEEIIIEEEGRLPVTTITEGPVEEIIEEIILPTSHIEFIKPVEDEETRKQVTVTEEVIEGKKPKKIIKNKIIKRRKQKEQVTEETTIKEKRQLPITTGTEGPVEEIVEETVLPLLQPKLPFEEEMRKQVTITEEIIKEEKSKKISKNKIEEQKQWVTEEIIDSKKQLPITTIIESPIQEIAEEIVFLLPQAEFATLLEEKEIRETELITVTEELIEGKKPKEITKKKVIKCKGQKQVTEETIEEKEQLPVTTITEGMVKEITEIILPPLQPEFAKPLEKEENKEQITITEQVIEEKKPKRTTKNKIIKHKGHKEQMTRETTEEQKQLPVKIVTEGTVEKIVLSSPQPEFAKPLEEEKIQKQIIEEAIEGKKPKKITKKKIIKRKEQKQQRTEEIIQEQEQLPITVMESLADEIVEETILPLPQSEFAKRNEDEEIKKQETITEEIIEDEKPKKITTKKIIKRKGQKQQVTEETIIEEKGQLPVTTIMESPVEEVVEETILPLLQSEFAKPFEEEDIKEQVAVTEEIIEDKKPKKITTKKIIKRKEQKQQVTEETTIEEKGQPPITTVMENPVEEVIEETILPLLQSEFAKPFEEGDIREQVTVTEEIIEGEKPKKITTKKVIKQKEQKQQVTQKTTVEEQGQLPITTITEGPLEEIVEETEYSMPQSEFAKPFEEEDISEQVTITEEIIEGKKPKKITTKKVIKRKGQKQQVIKETTIEEKGQPPVTTVMESPVEEIVEETVLPLLQSEFAKPFEEENIREQVTVTEEIIEGEKPKKITTKTIIKQKGQKQQMTQETTVEEQGQLPITTITEGPLEEIVEETEYSMPQSEFAKPFEKENIREQEIITEEIIEDEKPKKITKKVIKQKEQKQQETTIEEQGQLPIITVTEGPLEEIVEKTVLPLSHPKFVKPCEKEEVKEETKVTEIDVGTKKPKKITKKQIIKHKGQEQQVTEEITVEENDKSPVTSITVGPIEEIVEETLLPSQPDFVKIEEENIKRDTLIEKLVKEEKPKKIKKKIIKQGSTKTIIISNEDKEEQGTKVTNLHADTTPEIHIKYDEMIKSKISKKTLEGKFGFTFSVSNSCVLLKHTSLLYNSFYIHLIEYTSH